jgi:hypothetical protein
MTKIGIALSFVVAAVLIVMILRWLLDRAARRPGTYSADTSADNSSPGGNVWQRAQHDTSYTDAGGGDGGGAGGGD